MGTLAGSILYSRITLVTSWLFFARRVEPTLLEKRGTIPMFHQAIVF